MAYLRAKPELSSEIIVTNFFRKFYTKIPVCPLILYAFLHYLVYDIQNVVLKRNIKINEIRP